MSGAFPFRRAMPAENDFLATILLGFAVGAMAGVILGGCDAGMAKASAQIDAIAFVSSGVRQRRGLGLREQMFGRE